MTQLLRLGNLARHFATFWANFAHGALVSFGLVVLALILLQVSRHGFQGLSLDHLALGRSSVAAEDNLVFDDAGSSSSQLPADLQRAARFLARKYRVATVAVEPIVAEAVRSGRTHNLDPLLILAIGSIESGFNPMAESSFGAQGLMQVVPRFHMDKLPPELGARALLDPVENVRVGALVLKEYLRSTGSIEAALQQYGGAASDASMAYSNKVMAELQRIRAASQGGTVAKDS